MEGQWGDIIDIVNEPQLEQGEVAYNLPNIKIQFNETNRINKVKTSGPLPFFHVKRNETLTVNIEPIYFDGPLVVGLVHDHPDVQQNEIVNKNSSDEEVDCEKLAAFEVWNENSACKKAVYLKMKTDKYGSVIVALMKLSPGEKFCIKFNTEGRHVKNLGDKAANRKWNLIALPLPPSSTIDWENCSDSELVMKDFCHYNAAIGTILLQVTAEIRPPPKTKRKWSDRTKEFADAFEAADDEKKRKIEDILNEGH